MSRDDKASYYDLELPDGTRTEVWSVLRAVLTPEEALGYVKACILTRIMRDGKKDVDRLREAEKVAVEAGMLREAMEAYLATPDPAAAALDAVDSHDPPEMATVRDLARMCHEAGFDVRFKIEKSDHDARLAELERERDEARKTAQDLLMESQSWQLRHREAEAERDHWRASFDRTESDMMSLRKTLAAEREAHEATRQELERVRVEAKSLALHDRAERQAAAATAEELERVRRELTNAQELCESNLSKSRHFYQQLQETQAELLRERLKLNEYEERYRPRRQGEEPAPLGKIVSEWAPHLNSWVRRHAEYVDPKGIWTHQPPAPEGE